MCCFKFLSRPPSTSFPGFSLARPSGARARNLGTRLDRPVSDNRNRLKSVSLLFGSRTCPRSGSTTDKRKWETKAIEKATKISFLSRLG